MGSGNDGVSMSDNEVLKATRAQLDRNEVPDWITDHLRRYHEDPAEAQWWDATGFGGHARTPTLLLTVTGRKTGRKFTTPLICGEDNGRHVIIGSKGGAPTHPVWYLNLMANPEVEVQVAADRFTARARTVTGEERARLFAMMTEVYPPYPSYQSFTERELPVVVLERV